MNVRSAIIDGLQALYLLRLPGTPAANKLGQVGEVWIGIIEQYKQWDEQRDKGRIEAAFAKLLANVRQWPAPCQLIDCLPPQIDLPKQLPAISKEERDEINKEMVALCQKIKMGRRLEGTEQYQRLCRRLSDDCRQIERMIATENIKRAQAEIHTVIDTLQDLAKKLSNVEGKYDGK